MNITQINSSDISGGAEKISLLLHTTYQRYHFNSLLYVSKKQTLGEGIITLPFPPSIRYPLDLLKFYKKDPVFLIKQLLISVVNQFEKIRGIEKHHVQNHGSIVNLICNYSDIIHAHNLHGGYFDLSLLPKLSKLVPVVITLHDEWLFTGHCASTFGCERWTIGCGQCPHLDTYPPIKRDNSQKNLHYKISQVAQSHLYIATPSMWLADRVKRSMIQPREIRLINNGIDLGIYHPGDKLHERQQLGIDPKAFVMLYIANKGINNPFRDYTTVYEALNKIHLTGKSKKWVLLSIGGNEVTTTSIGDIQVINIPYISDENSLASYYQSANVLLYATHADNFPTIILEAMASGLVVIATDVGGIREQIIDGETGFLIPENDSTMMAEKISEIAGDPMLGVKMGIAASDYSTRQFDVELMAKQYLDWYQEIIASRTSSSEEKKQNGI